MTPQEELDQIYISIGEGAELTEAISARIEQLEAIANPFAYTPSEIKEEGCGCGQPRHCWECAAIRGGCPEDA